VSKSDKEAARDELASDRERIAKEQQRAAEEAAKERPKGDK
jgi:outer membrane murein-binding lipoprotein Lpp